MKNLQNLIYKMGSTTNFFVILLIILALNVSWLVTLNAFGNQFEQIAGLQPIDLQNTSNILSAEQAIEQITTYTTEAKTFYWSFFILDNLMPPLSFGIFSVLWAYYFSRHDNRLFDRLKTSPILLLPWGVGLFDWFENLCCITVMGNPTATNALQIMDIGLLLVRFKAACLLTTFALTMILTVYHVIASLRRIALKSPDKQNAVLQS